MQSWTNRQFAVDTLERLANGDDVRGHVALATMCRNKATIAAVNRAREAVSKDRWHEIDAAGWMREVMTDAERDTAKAVWRTMPGYTCLADAVTILARL